ncbi:MAG: hypothetical protein ACRD4L_15170, partial [Pyrinomonadaceae bacterium]
ADLESVGVHYHNWMTEAVTDLVFNKLEAPAPVPRYRWDELLNPSSISTTPSKNKPAKSARSAQSRIKKEKPESKVKKPRKKNGLNL